MEKIMILGAGVYQVPLIKKAKEMNLKTVVVSRKGNYPGIPLADIFLDVDTTDSDRIIIEARKYKIAGVVTTGTDVCVPAMGRLVDELDFPGTGYEAACRSMDKVLMKRMFRRHRVPTAEFDSFTKIHDAKSFAASIGYPVMVKAPDSSGSRGVVKVSKPEDFSAAWERAYEVSRSKEIIIEEFLEGIEYGAQAFVEDEKVVAVFPHGDTVTGPPYATPIGHSIPSPLTEEQKNKTTKIIEEAVQAIGIKDCVSNVDLMLVNGEPKIIEIGARMGATCLPELISHFTGMDVYEYLILLAMGSRQEIKIQSQQPSAGILLRSKTTGTVESIFIPDEVLNHPSLLEFEMDVSVGDSVRAFQLGPDRIGHLIVKSENANSAEVLANQLADKVKLNVQPD